MMEMSTGVSWRGRAIGERRRGAVLVVALIILGVISFSMGAILVSVRHYSVATRDKVAYEQAYHSALGGVAATKSWVMNPTLAKSHLGNTEGAKIETITSAALALSDFVRANRTDNSMLNMSSAQIVAKYAELGHTITPVATLADGDRAVLFSYEPANGVVRYPDDGHVSATLDLFDGTLSDASVIVKRVRITTPYRSSGSSSRGVYIADDLRKVSLIIEAESEIAGKPSAVASASGTTTGGGGSAGNSTKNRIIQQRLLVVPGVADDPTPLAGSDAALIAGQTIAPGNNSSQSVNWAPAMAKGNINLVGMSKLSAPKNAAQSWGMSVADNKYYGAGVGPTEKWVRWMTAATLFAQPSMGQIAPLFEDVSGVQVTDFFTQVKMNAFSSLAYPITSAKLSLSGFNSSYNGTLWSSSSNVFFKVPEGQALPTMGSGALIQNTASVGTSIDGMFQQFNYADWKNYAIANNGYARMNAQGTNYVNSENQPLYVTPSRNLTAVSTGNTLFTNLKQVSMKPLVPTGGNTHGLPDRVLFLDTPQGTENGTPINVALNSSDDFFWKGLLYVNGNFSTSGGGAFPSVWMQNPDQYTAAPGQTGTGNGTLTSNCYLDGIVFITGSMSRTGNAAVYGSVITKGSYGGAGGPDIFYNTRLKNGLFTNSSGSAGSDIFAQAVTGPIVELNQW